MASTLFRNVEGKRSPRFSRRETHLGWYPTSLAICTRVSLVEVRAAGLIAEATTLQELRPTLASITYLVLDLTLRDFDLCRNREPLDRVVYYLDLSKAVSLNS